MSIVSAVVIVVATSIGTYLCRAGMILLLAGRTLPEQVERALRQVGPAVLAALVVTFVASAEVSNRGLTAGELAALSAAVAVHWWRKNLVVTLAGGMAAFWLVQGLSGG